jgi:hypothetical protein
MWQVWSVSRLSEKPHHTLTQRRPGCNDTSHTHPYVWREEVAMEARRPTLPAPTWPLACGAAAAAVPAAAPPPRLPGTAVLPPPAPAALWLPPCWPPPRWPPVAAAPCCLLTAMPLLLVVPLGLASLGPGPPPPPAAAAAARAPREACTVVARVGGVWVSGLSSFKLDEQPQAQRGVHSK